MARAVVLSNGELHVGLNRFGLVHDFYFPYVGLENHCAGRDLRHKVGVWVEGHISWLDDGSWDVRSWTAEGALIGHTRAKHDGLGVIVEFDDAVDSDVSVFMRNIHVINAKDRQRDIRLFMHQAFTIGDSRSNTDTAQYLPDSNAILHYRGRRAFVVSGLQDGKPFDQHSIGIFGIEGHEGTYRDADDGELAGGDVEHGRVDSTLRFQMHIDAFESKHVQYWLTAGTSMREALHIHRNTVDVGIDRLIHQTALSWHDWLAPARAVAEHLPKEYRSSFLHSALIVKAHIDKRGAIIASTDTTMLNYSRDAYAYCWPRDAAYALWPLIRLGYVAEPRRFFEFARRGLHQNGYLMHKYQADGAVGSSWHPYVHGGTSAPPIQEDETALTLFMFAQFYLAQHDAKLLTEFYDSFVKKMADFVAGYVDESTGLPRPSYDLWEENFMTSTYTTSVAYGSLIAAVQLAEAAGDADSAVRWRAAADDIQQAAHKHLFNSDRNYFLKGLRPTENGYELDTTMDMASFYGAFMFGLFDIKSDEVLRSFEQLKQTFTFNAAMPGLPRYENDNYHRTEATRLGNWWFITSLWVAQYSTEQGDHEATSSIVEWVLRNADSSNMLAEQLEPDTLRSMSVSPLVWSHAELMATMLDAAEVVHE